MTNKSIITSALAALVATGALAGATQALAADKPDKCYGIAKVKWTPLSRPRSAKNK